MNNVSLSKHLWKLSYVVFTIVILWAIWIFGFWYYYDEKISLAEGSILLGLFVITIMIREIALTALNQERRKNSENLKKIYNKSGK